MPIPKMRNRNEEKNDDSSIVLGVILPQSCVKGLGFSLDGYLDPYLDESHLALIKGNIQIIEDSHNYKFSRPEA